MRRGLVLHRKQRSGHTALHKAAEMGQRNCCAFILSLMTPRQMRNTALCPGEEEEEEEEKEEEKEEEEEEETYETEETDEGGSLGAGRRGKEKGHRGGAGVAVVKARASLTAAVGGGCSSSGDSFSRGQRDKKKMAAAHLPSSLATKNGHHDCAALLRAAGL